METARGYSSLNLAGKPKKSRTRAKKLRTRELLSGLEPRIMLALDYWVAKTHVDQAWNIAGNSPNIVAIIDTGADITHPDIAPHLYTKPANLIGLDGVPNDVNGANFGPVGLGLPPDGNLTDINGHGTGVASLVAGVTDQLLGTTGVNQAAQLMIIKADDPSGLGFFTRPSELAAMEYVIRLKTIRHINIRVINMSLGGNFFGPRNGIADPTIPQFWDLVDKAGQAGIIVVIAAANNGEDNDVVNVFPANTTNNLAVTVAATDQNDVIAPFSDWGKTSVDVAAPGVNIVMDAAGGGSWIASGTSMASPITAGIISLMISTFPNLPPDKILNALYNTVDKTAGLSNLIATGGRVNAYRAIESLLGNVPGFGVVDALTNYRIQGWAYDKNVGTAPVNITIKVDGQTVAVVPANQPRADLAKVFGAADSKHGFTYKLTGLTPGNHTVQVFREETMTDAVGNLSTSLVLMKSAIVSGTVLPFGWVDSYANMTITGWAFDPNLGPLADLIRVDLDGVPIATSTAAQPRPDLVPVVGSPLHGFNYQIVGASPGLHRVDVWAIDDASPFTPVLIGSGTVNNSALVDGWVDTANQKQIIGWAADTDAINTTVKLQLIIDGNEYAMLPNAANQLRPDLTFSNQNHGFVINLPALSAGKTHSVQLWAVDVNTGQKRRLTAYAVQGNQDPVGWVDFSDKDLMGVQHIAGWIADPDETTPIQYRIDIDDNTGTLSTTTIARPDLTFLPGSALLHGFDVPTPMLNPGIYTLKLYGIDPWTQQEKLVFIRQFNVYDNSLNARPIGSIDTLTASGATGIATDPNNPSATLTVNVVIDGAPAGSTTANLNTPAGANGHGFNISFGSLTPGRHTIELYAVDSTNPAQLTLIKQTVVDAAPISGWIDIAAADRIVGWGQVIGSAVVPTLRIDVNGQEGIPFLANVSRPDSLAGFDLRSIPLVPGSTNTVTLNYIDLVTGRTIVLDRKTLTVKEPPLKFTVDQIGGGKIRGWVYAPYNLAADVNIQVRVDGTPALFIPADQNRGDLGSLPQQDHAFDITIPFVGSGKHTITLYGEDPASGRLFLLGSGNVLI